MTERDHVYKPMRDALPQAMWTRLENLVGQGMPDVHGCYQGVDVWIENKLVKGHRIIFQPTQPAWMMKRMAHGGRVYVLARKGDDLLLWSGRSLRALLMSCKPVGKNLVADYRDSAPVLVLSKPFDWDRLLFELFTAISHR